MHDVKWCQPRLTVKVKHQGKQNIAPRYGEKLRSIGCYRAVQSYDPECPPLVSVCSFLVSVCSFLIVAFDQE